MRRRVKKREMKRMEGQAYSSCSEAFRYVHKNFESLCAAGIGKRSGPSWEYFADLLARDGLTNAAKQPLTPNAARLVFRRVEQAIAAENKAAQPKAAAPPRQPRPKPNWSPPVAPVASATIPRASVPGTTTTDRSSPAPDDGFTEEARAQLAALDRQLEWRDRFLHPPKLKE